MGLHHSSVCSWSAHYKTYLWNNVFTWREERRRVFVCVWYLCEQETSPQSHFQCGVTNVALHLCLAPISLSPSLSLLSLLSWRQSVSSHLHQSCHPRLSVVCRVHAIPVCRTSGVCMCVWVGGGGGDYMVLSPCVCGWALQITVRAY